MSAETLPYVLALFAAALGMMALTVPAWRMRREPVVVLFITTSVVTSLWPLAVGLELSSTEMAWKEAFARMRPVLVVLSVSTLALLILEFTGKLAAYRRYAHWAFLAGTVAVAVMAATPLKLGWFHHRFVVSPQVPYRLIWDAGPLEWVFFGYVMVLTVSALVVLIRSMKGRGSAYQRSVQMILAGTSVPVILSVSARFHLTNWVGIHLFAMGLLVPAAAWFVALYRHGMLNLVPLGRATVLETMRDLVFILDHRGSLADCNGAALAALGPTAKLDEPWASAVRYGGTPHFEHDGKTYEITRNPILNAAGAEAGQVVSLHDVTEWLQIRELLQDSHHLEMVGQLAGGMAHEYNNLLTVILGYAAVIKRASPPGSPVLPLVDRIDEAGKKAAKLTAQMLSFSRRQLLVPIPLRIGEVLEEMESLLRQVLGEQIEFAIDVEPAEPLVKVDRRQLELLLVELVLNARDAMPNGGNVEIRVSHRGAEMLLVVGDSGLGMDAKTQARIFEPFFTTHRDANRAGLGLPMVLGFVTQSGGRLDVRSEPGEGTEVGVFLPVYS